MRKALRIIAVSSGIISVVSMAILGFVYLEDILGHLNIFKDKLFKKIYDKKITNEQIV